NVAIIPIVDNAVGQMMLEGAIDDSQTPNMVALAILRQNLSNIPEAVRLLEDIGMTNAEIKNVIEVIEKLNEFDEKQRNAIGSTAHLVLNVLIKDAASIDNLAEAVKDTAKAIIIRSSAEYMTLAHIEALMSFGLSRTEAGLLVSIALNENEPARKLIIMEIGNSLALSGGEFTRVVLGVVLEHAQDLRGILEKLNIGVRDPPVSLSQDKKQALINKINNLKEEKAILVTSLLRSLSELALANPAQSNIKIIEIKINSLKEKIAEIDAELPELSHQLSQHEMSSFTYRGLGWKQKTIDAIVDGMEILGTLDASLAQAVKADIARAFIQNLGTLREQDIKFHMNRIIMGALFANANGDIEAIKPALEKLDVDLSADLFTNFDKLTRQEQIKLTGAIGEHLLGAGFTSGAVFNNLNRIDINKLLRNSVIINALNAGIETLENLDIQIEDDRIMQIIQTQADAAQTDNARLALLQDITNVMQHLSLDRLARMHSAEIMRLMGDIAMPLNSDYTLMQEFLKTRPNILLRNITPEALSAIQSLAESLPRMTNAQLAVFAVYGVAPMSVLSIARILEGTVQVKDGNVVLTPEQKTALKSIGVKEQKIDDFETINEIAENIAANIANAENFKNPESAKNIVNGLGIFGIPVFKGATLRQAKAVFAERATMIKQVLPIIERLVRDGSLGYEAGQNLLYKFSTEHSTLTKDVNIISKLSALSVKMAEPEKISNWLKSKDKSVVQKAIDFFRSKVVNRAKFALQARETYVINALNKNYEAALDNLLGHIIGDDITKDAVKQAVLLEGKSLKEALEEQGIRLENLKDIPKQITESLKVRVQEEGLSESLILDATSAFTLGSLLTRGYTPFAEQLYAGKLLAQDIIIQMGTGEGKTLASVLALYLHALTGNGAHQLVTTDAYAERDCLDTKQVFDILGIKSTYVTKDMGITEEKIADEAERSQEILRLKQEAYNAEVTYIACSTIAFDILHDLKVADRGGKYIQRALNYANVDEIDNIILDQALSEFILSEGQGVLSEGEAAVYKIADMIARQILFEGGEVKTELREIGGIKQEIESNEYYILNKTTRELRLTEKGTKEINSFINVLKSMDSMKDIPMPETKHVQRALEAHLLYEKDWHYRIEVKHNEKGELII
ncbi:MAG: hypothetical protein KAU58_04485, partial [Candidatus Omnitrophica bacterium]|nr:hypothetical protein [Candidatus Omnitrophota bacterium]